MLLRSTSDLVATPAQIQNWIYLTEAEFNRKLRIPELEATTQLVMTANQGYSALPAGYKRMSMLIFNSEPWDIDQATRKEVIQETVNNQNSQPRKFVEWAKQLWWGPVPDSAYTMTFDYYVGITPLDPAINMSSNVLLAFPDLYLYGALKQAQMQLADITKGQLWTANYNQIMEDVELAAQKEKMSSSLRMRPTNGPIGRRMF
jgi:hypothetical protein